MEEIAQVYSRALFEVAQESGNLDTIREQLAQFADAIDADRGLQTFFFSPYFSTDEKKDGLHKAVEGADPALVNFLELLIEKHRVPAVFRIRRDFDAKWREANKLLSVQLTSAIALDDATVADLGRTIGDRAGRKVDVSANVDPDILGGIVLRVGNSVLDASIRNRLESLRKQVARS